MSIYSHFHSGNYVGRLRKAKMTRFSFTNHDIWAGMLRRFIDKYSIDVLNSQCIHAIVFTICVEAIYIDLPSLLLWASCGPRARLCIMWYFIIRKQRNGEMVEVRKFSLLFNHRDFTSLVASRSVMVWRLSCPSALKYPHSNWKS